MTHNLRAKLSGLRYKRILEDKDYKRLCRALDNEDVLDKIRAEIDAIYKEDMECDGCSDMGMVLDIIDKYKAGENEKKQKNVLKMS